MKELQQNILPCIRMEEDNILRATVLSAQRLPGSPAFASILFSDRF